MFVVTIQPLIAIQINEACRFIVYGFWHFFQHFGIMLFRRTCCQKISLTVVIKRIKNIAHLLWRFSRSVNYLGHSLA